MPDPLVTICVPTRNRVAALRDTLESIREQDYPCLEVVVSDNGSTDETEQVCLKAVAADERIRYVRQQRNIGLHGNHNFCMDEARGEYLSFFHDHDHHDRCFISRHVAFLERHPRVGLVGSNWGLIDDVGGQLGGRAFPGASVSSGVEYTTRTIRSGRSSIGIPGAMIRAAALGTARFGLDAPIGFGDFPIWFRIAEQWDIGHIPDQLSSWRQNAESLSLRPIVEIMRDYEKNIGDYCDDHLRRCPAHAKLVDTWRASLRRYVFWALVYEIALHFRPRGAPPTSPEARTLFEIMDYELSPDQFERAIAGMERYRSGVVEHAAAAAVQALIRLRLTSPLGWAVRHHGTLRALLRLE